MPTFNFNAMSNQNQKMDVSNETKSRLDIQDELIKNLSEKVENLVKAQKDFNYYSKDEINELLAIKKEDN